MQAPREEQAEQVAPMASARQPGGMAEAAEQAGAAHAATSESEAASVTAQVESAIDALPARGSPLPQTVRSFMEPRFKADFSRVRIHNDAASHALARSVNAQAFTVGRDVVFGAGYYAPESNQGRHLLAHELTHVIQQGHASAPADSTLQRQAAAPAEEVVQPAAPAAASPAAVVPAPAAPPAAPAATTGPTGDSLLNEWLAEHSADHLSSDLTWIQAQWPTGGSLADLNADFATDVQMLLNFVGTTPSASFPIISYARTPQKQHVMHVGQYIRKNWVGYNSYKFSGWDGVTAAGGRAGLLALPAAERKTQLQSISNPELLSVVWDTGTSTASRSDGTAVAAAYNIGIDNPVANGGATYSWPTGNASTSLHGSGNAVDADPVALPNQVTIRQNQASAWPDAAAAQAAFGAANVQVLAATPTEPAGYTITGTADVARRDAFLETFFEVRSAARAGFTDPQHFQAP
jgi:hypothetical protein